MKTSGQKPTGTEKFEFFLVTIVTECPVTVTRDWVPVTVTGPVTDPVTVVTL